MHSSYRHLVEVDRRDDLFRVRRRKRRSEATLDRGALKGDLRVWRFDQDSGDKVVQLKEPVGAADGTVTLKLPAASASMLVIAPRK